MKKADANSQSDDIITSDGTNLDDLTIAEAASICGYTDRWLRQMVQDGYFAKKSNGRVRLRDVVHGFERQILGWRPPGYDGYRR